MPDARTPAAVRRAVADRAAGCCEYCFSQAAFSPDPFSVEHITPRSRGGSHDPGNLAFSCQGCNSRKYTRVEGPDPISGEPTTLYHPRRHLREEHFAWNEDYTILVGKTPTGRATIALLELNRAEVVNLRRALAQTGEHPPPQFQ
jgi:hypothetical protein